MTEEDLKKIEGPETRPPLTERQKRVNAFWLQMLGAFLLIALALVFVCVLFVASAVFLARVVHADASVMGRVWPVDLAIGIAAAWFLSRKICAALVKHTRLGQSIPDDVVDFYSGR